MGLFSKKSQTEEQLSAVAMSIGEAAAKTLRGEMPPDYFESVCSFRRSEVRSLHRQVAEAKGQDVAREAALKAADVGASEWGKYGGKAIQAHARSMTANAMRQMIDA